MLDSTTALTYLQAMGITPYARAGVQLVQPTAEPQPETQPEPIPEPKVQPQPEPEVVIEAQVAEAEQAGREGRCEASDNAMLKLQRAAIAANQLDTPGLHAQCLAVF